MSQLSNNGHIYNCKGCHREIYVRAVVLHQSDKKNTLINIYISIHAHIQTAPYTHTTRLTQKSKMYTISTQTITHTIKLV